MNAPNRKEARLKKLGLISRRRGMREMDLILGKFSEMYLEGFSETQLNEYEAILASSDNDICDWISGRTPLPAIADGSVLAMLILFAAGRI